METKLWRIMHLYTCEDYYDENGWDMMVAEECAIIECTEEQVKEICDKATPIKEDDDYIFNKFVYFEVKPVKTFDPEQWIIAEKSCFKLHHIPVDAYKQLSEGAIDSYADDDGWCRAYSCKGWDYKQALNELDCLRPETYIDFDYIKGGNDNA